MRRIRRIRKVVLIVAICALIISLWMIVGQDWFDAWRAQSVEDSTKDLYYSSSVPGSFSIFPTAHAEEVVPAQPELPDVQQDFLALYEANPDTVGWLKAGEKMDYPIVQRDNWHYLTRNFYGKKDSNGTLFLNSYCSLIPRSDVLLIHGHNTRNGAMFARLLDYEEYTYAAENPLVTFRTIYDEADVYYTPVYAFHASMEEKHAEYLDIAKVDFSEEELNEKQAYLDAMQERSIWTAPIDVTTDDELLMLVTCSYYQTNGRFLLVCRKLRADETPEMISELYAKTIAE